MANAQLRVQFVRNERGNPSLVYNDNRYVVKLRRDERTYWRCSVRACPATVRTLNNILVGSNGTHNHSPDRIQLQVDEVMNTIKSRCREETKPCPQIYQEVVSGLRNPKWDDDTQRMVERLPTYQSCHNVLHQQRSKLLPKLPTTQADLVLQGEWTETTVGERFLLTDSNDAGRRIIIYATDSNLELLTNCSTIYGDGTFYVCPGVFNQLYSLHGCVDGHFYPLVFAFLPGKSTDVYLRFWDLLKSACDDGLQLEPATVFLDFESAMHSATRSAFPSVTLKGCFFHFTKCVWRKDQQTGLQIPYQQNDAIKLIVRRAAALPLVPLDRIEDVWEFALQELWDTDFPVARTEPFVDYVTEQWVDRDRLVWNHFNSDGPRTTNHLEGWHSKIKKQVQIAHPNMYQIIRHLKQIQASNEISIVQIRAGGLPKPKKRKYRNIDSRIRNLQRRLQASEIDVFEYVDEASLLIHLGSKKPRGPKAPKLPDPFDNGTILSDVRKKQWKLGNQIGQGGFGLIYLASDEVSAPVGPTAEYVVKIEPHANGPLFCELHFYQRAAKPDMVDSWCRSNHLRYLGIPKFIASGSHMRGKENFRFMIMPRFGSDLQKVFEGSGKRLEKNSVYCLAIRMIDALEYLHENDYVHADVKASNMLLGFHGGKILPNEIYLVDFGLAHRYKPDGTHRPYKEDPKRCHDGTVEFTSIDAHKGVAPSRRGDLEILGYCLLQWLCSKLPWEDNLENKDYVRDSKIRYTKDLNSLMKKCFPSGNQPAEILKYFTIVTKLGYDAKPNYDQLRGLFKDGLKKISWSDEWKLDLPISETGAKKSVNKRRTTEDAKPQQAKPAARGRKSAKTVTSPVKSPSQHRVTSPETPVNSDLKVIKKARGTPRGTPQSAAKKTTPALKTLKQPIKSPRNDRSPVGKRKEPTPVRKTLKQPLMSPETEEPPTKKLKETPPVKKAGPQKPTVGCNRRFVKRSKAPKKDAWMQTSPQK
ncbi:hypothetical protein FSP39_021504 [Pinctada imbricata]|uniref:non-specific serine/threonine protein kinase n=1 Tax=Pinctada imbricata TaxID=66713 RepID=A0AA88Y4A3_PINIB|nr:hypothetical protein FSP39_021504 [Pinctada imbricata]